MLSVLNVSDNAVSTDFGSSRCAVWLNRRISSRSCVLKVPKKMQYLHFMSRHVAELVESFATSRMHSRYFPLNFFFFVPRAAVGGSSGYSLARNGMFLMQRVNEYVISL